jgi:hypothetical protein
MDGPMAWYETPIFSGFLGGGLAGAVITILTQFAIRWWNRPRLVLLPYEHRQPMYRSVPIGATDKKSFWVNIGVQNRGRTVAERCRPVVTAMAEWKQNRYVKDENWLPADLRWSRH